MKEIKKHPIPIALIGIVLLAGIGFFFATRSTSDDPKEVAIPASESASDKISRISNQLETGTSNPDLYVERGQAYLELGNYDSALEDFSQALQLDGTQVEAYLYRGIIYYDLENFEGATADIEQALALNPQSPLAHLYYGRLLFDKNDLLNAVTEFSEAIRLDEALADAYLYRGNLYEKQYEYKRAFADYDKAIRLEPENGVYYAHRALIAYYLNDHELVHTDSALAVQYASQYALAQTMQAVVYLLDVKNAEALELLSQVINAQNDVALAFVFRGEAFRMAKDYEAALADFQKAIELEPALPLIYWQRAKVYVAQGETARAIENYSQTIDLYEGWADVYYERGLLYQKNREQRSQAIADYSSYLALMPDDATVYVLRGWLHFQDKNTEAALADFTQAITLDVSYGDAYRNRSLVYSSLNMTQESRLDREKANALSTNQIAVFEQYDLELKRIWHTENAGETSPDNDMFLVMEIVLYNYTPDRLCVSKDDFRLQVGDKKYTPSKMYQVGQAYYPDKLYPPSEGQDCLPATRMWDTFLAYDIPTASGELLMQLEIEDFRNNFRLQLTPTETVDYGFYITELNGQSNVSIGEIRLDTREEVKTVVDSQRISIENCNGNAERETTESLSRQTSREVRFENEWKAEALAGGSPIFNVAKFALPLTIEIKGFYRSKVSQNETDTIVFEREETMRAAPHSIAVYEITWYLVEKQGEVDVLQNNNVYTAHFTIDDAIRADVKSIESRSCDN